MSSTIICPRSFVWTSIACIVMLAVLVPSLWSVQAQTVSPSEALGDALVLHPNAVVTNQLWVSPTGNDDAAGTQAAPLRTINAAVGRATPGTAIMVRAGTYRENVQLNNLRSTTAQSPILLVSADGPQAATVIAARGDRSTVEIFQSSHIGVHGFDLIGDWDGRTHDISVVKQIGNRTNPPQNVVLARNQFSGRATDLVKFTQSTRNLIVGNVFTSTVVSEEHLDFVGVSASRIAYNTFRGSATNAFTHKTGSVDNVIEHNDFQMTRANPVLKIGGEGRSDFDNAPNQSSIPAIQPTDTHFMAKGTQIRNNIIRTDTGVPIWFRGAHDAVLDNNFLQSGPGQPHIQYMNTFLFTADYITNPNSTRNTVTNNVHAGQALVTRQALVADSLMVVPNYTPPDQTTGNIVSGNRSGTLADITFTYGATSYVGQTISVPPLAQTAGPTPTQPTTAGPTPTQSTTQPTQSTTAQPAPASTATPLPARPPIVAGSAIGKTFVTFERLNIRAAAGTSAAVLGVADRFTAGIIQSEPVSANGFTWYRVHFFRGDIGWVAGEYVFILEDHVAGIPGAATTPRAPSSTTAPAPTSTSLAVPLGEPTQVLLRINYDLNSTIARVRVAGELERSHTIATAPVISDTNAMNSLYTQIATMDPAFADRTQVQNAVVQNSIQRIGGLNPGSIHVRFDGIFDWRVDIVQINGDRDPDSPITHSDIIDFVFEGDRFAYERWMRNAFRGIIGDQEGFDVYIAPINSEARLIEIINAEIAEELGISPAEARAISTYQVSCLPFDTCRTFDRSDSSGDR